MKLQIGVGKLLFNRANISNLKFKSATLTQINKGFRISKIEIIAYTKIINYKDSQ